MPRQNTILPSVSKNFPVLPTQSHLSRLRLTKSFRICKSLDAKCIALAGLPESLVTEIEDRCAGIKVLKEPYPAETLPGAIDEADVGVTGIAFAIAQSGTLVEISTDDVVRLVSGLPRTYIGVLHAVDIVNKFRGGACTHTRHCKAT